MKSLKLSLLIRLLVGGVVLLGVAGSVVHWRMKQALVGEFDAGLRLSAQSLAVLIEQGSHGVKMESEADSIPQFQRERGDAVFVVFREDGSEIKRSHSLGQQTLPMRGGSWQQPVFFETRLQDHRKLRCIGVYLEARVEDDEPHPTPAQKVLLVVGRMRTSLDYHLEELRNALLAGGGIALVLLGALLLWSVCRGLRPLDRLVDEISGIEANSLSLRLPEEPLPAELRPIAQQLNASLARLEAVFAREKRFTADVSHELRTPLAELRALAEVNLMVPPQTAAERAENWEEVKDVSGRMESLALRLLELARLEDPSRSVQRGTVDVVALVDKVWKRHAALAGERAIACQCEIPEGLCWQSDPLLLDLIVTNLIGNAVQHADPESILRITADDHGMRFTNVAQGLRAEDVESFFERFWKKDAARSDGRRHGLGLALARETAVLLGGSLEASIAGAGTVVFELRV